MPHTYYMVCCHGRGEMKSGVYDNEDRCTMRLRLCSIAGKRNEYQVLPGKKGDGGVHKCNPSKNQPMEVKGEIQYVRNDMKQIAEDLAMKEPSKSGKKIAHEVLKSFISDGNNEGK